MPGWNGGGNRANVAAGPLKLSSFDSSKFDLMNISGDPANNFINTAESVSLPSNGITGATNGLRVPGGVYCSTPECTGHSILSGTGSSDSPVADTA